MSKLQSNKGVRQFFTLQFKAEMLVSIYLSKYHRAQVGEPPHLTKRILLPE